MKITERIFVPCCIKMNNLRTTNGVTFSSNHGCDDVYFSNQESIVIDSLLKGLALKDISLKTSKSIKTVSSQNGVHIKINVSSNIGLLIQLINLKVIFICN